MIEVENLSKRYGDFYALSQLSFNVKKGEILGFLGPNGAGKTSTMRILTAYYEPTEGRVSVAGFDVRRQANEVKKRIGYLPETPPLYPEMTVESYLRFIMELKKLERQKRRDQLEWALEKCGLKDRRRSVIATLSKGYRQRVGLAQAIIHKPPVIILDEPTVGLDPVQIVEIRELIQSFRHEHTLMLSTHILSEVTASCDRALMINHGKIVHEESLSDDSGRRSLEEVFLEVMTTGQSEKLAS